MKQLNQSRLSQLHPKLQSLGNKFLQAATKAGITVLITQGLRTWAEQDALYAQGRTTPGKVVTWAKGGFSLHNFGLAFDVVPLDAMGKMNWDSSHPAWQELGKLGKAVGFEWGGDWSPRKRDLPHFQYTGGLTLEQCRQYYDAGGMTEVWKHVT